MIIFRWSVHMWDFLCNFAPSVARVSQRQQIEKAHFRLILYYRKKQTDYGWLPCKTTASPVQQTIKPMKKKTVIALAALLTMATAGRAQAVVSCDNLKVLYAGIDNPITVAVAGEKANNVTVGIADGTATIEKAQDAGHYIVKPTGESKSVTLEVSKKSRKGMEPVARHVYKVKPLPSPTIRLAGYRDGDSVSRKHLTEGTLITASLPEGFEFEVPANALKVNWADVYIGNKAFRIGNKLTPDMVSAIRNVNKGDKVYITAYVSMPDGIPYPVNSVLTISDHKDFVINPLFDDDGNRMLDGKGRPLYEEEPYEEEWDE